MIFNELAQWACLAFVGTMLLGLLRQLGQFIVPRRDELLYRGPDIGKELPGELLDEVAAETFAARIGRAASGLGVLIVMNDRCVGCRGLIDHLEPGRRERDMPLLAVLDSRDNEFTAEVARTFDFVVPDEDLRRAHAAGIGATPYIIGVDADLKVRHRAIGGALDQITREWFGGVAGDDDASESARGQGIANAMS